MSETQRTDAHRPSAIIPTDYEFVAFDYCGPNMGFEMAKFLLDERERFQAHKARTGGTYAKHENSGSCHICGANAFYLVRWYHAKSNSYIVTGNDCANKLQMSYGDMNAFRRNVADAREAHAGKKKAIALLADQQLMRAWEVLETLDADRENEQKHFDEHQQSSGNFKLQYEELTIADMVRKLIKYGSLSAKQYNFIATLLARIDNRPIIEAQRAAEREAAEPCVSGRVRITGTVVGTKVVDDRFNRYSGEKTNIIVRDARGF
jgi:hypothetical protein